jgi:predicted acylesterase/phospholipase RssA
MTIKHIVISGGGPTGLLSYGAIRYLAKQKYWEFDNIETIYGPSQGAILAVVISLNFDWDILDDYVIKRPWGKVIEVKPGDFIESFSSKGVLSSSIIEIMVQPLLEAKEVSMDITLKEFYDFNNIEIHMYSAELHTFKKIDISYKTHPDLKLLTALKMTSAFPVMFPPIFYDGGCYIDGGVMNNYPIIDCLNQTKCSKDEVLGFHNYWEKYKERITEESSILEFSLYLAKQMVRRIDESEHNDKTPSIPNEVTCIAENNGEYDKWLDSLIKSENRTRLINRGETYGIMFYNYKKNLESSMQELL